MKSILKNLRHKIFVADMTNRTYLTDIIRVLDGYKSDGMGQSPPYTTLERDNLETLFSTEPSVKVFLLYVDDIVAGGAVCFSTFSTFSAKTIINIHDLCILKKYRGHGFGKELMKSIIIKAMELNCSKVTLEVREDNKVAKNLYNSLGFMESDPIMNFWHKPLYL